MEYKPLIIENLCFNITNLLNIKQPTVLGKLLAKRPLRPHIIATLQGTQVLKNVREDPDGLESSLDLCMVLHKQLIYYPEDFPEAQEEIKEFLEALEKTGNDKALNKYKNEIDMF